MKVYVGLGLQGDEMGWAGTDGASGRGHRSPGCASVQGACTGHPSVCTRGICVGVGTQCAIVCGWDGFVLCVEVCKGVDKGEGV